MKQSAIWDTGATGLKAETKLMNEREEIFIEPGGKMNYYKWHMVMKHKIEEDGVGDLKGMAYHSFLAWMKGGRKKRSRINASAMRGMWHFVEAWKSN